MTVKEIHEFIWNSIIKECEDQSINPDPFKESYDLVQIKRNTIDTLFTQHKISEEAYYLLKKNNHCIFCAINNTCETCNLYLQYNHHCAHHNSLYQRALKLLDIDAMKKIRDTEVTNEKSSMYKIGILEGESAEES